MDRIADFMSSPPLSVDVNSTTEVGAQLMCEKKVTSLLIKEGEDYVGIVTSTDLVQKLVAKGLNPKETKMSSVMSKPVISMGHHLPRSDANELMLRKKIKHLAVTKEGNVVGILTTKDMITGGGDESVY
ncbi:MAG: CBS domain-containing protein [Nitrospinae bacterium]|nr:CBS domain-containing protein [Nitrospinota bacterium]